MHLESWKKHLLLETNYSKNTVKSYENDIILLERFLNEYSSGQILISNLSKQVIRAWILYRQNKGDSPRSISRGISSIKSLHKFLIKNKIIEKSDILNMKSPKVSRTLPRPLTISQLNNVINSIHDIKQTCWIVKRDRALLTLIYSVGLRISEALSIKKEDIQNSSGYLNITGKGGKTRVVPLLDNVRKIIEEYIDLCPYYKAWEAAAARQLKAGRSRGLLVGEAYGAAAASEDSSSYLFVNRFGEQLHPTSVQRLMQKSRRLLNLSEKVTPHSLRHTCATHIMENSRDLRGIQELLGHSSISSTQIYADITKKYLTEVYDKCHPLSKENKCKKT
jgi:integrase/recombinase XerC